MRFLMAKREEPYFTMSITWWPCDFSWWDFRSHVSSWASRGDHEIFHGEDRGATFHHEHHVTTMRFLLVRWDGPCFIMYLMVTMRFLMVKMEVSYFTMRITWRPWDFSWWGGMSHASPWASRDDHGISQYEDGLVTFHQEGHVTTMRFLMVRWNEPCFTMSITWWPWDFSWWRGRSYISPWASRVTMRNFTVYYIRK